MVLVHLIADFVVLGIGVIELLNDIQPSGGQSIAEDFTTAIDLLSHGPANQLEHLYAPFDKALRKVVSTQQFGAQPVSGQNPV